MNCVDCNLRSTISQKRLNSTYADEVDALEIRMLVNSFIFRSDYRRKVCCNLLTDEPTVLPDCAVLSYSGCYYYYYYKRKI